MLHRKCDLLADPKWWKTYLIFHSQFMKRKAGVETVVPHVLRRVMEQHVTFDMLDNSARRPGPVSSPKNISNKGKSLISRF
jgi:hypothetical protein